MKTQIEMNTQLKSEKNVRMSLIAALVVASGMISSAWSAEVSSRILETHGAFVASECGASYVDPDLGVNSGIAAVCIGQTAAVEKQVAPSVAAVEIRLENGKSKVFRVARIDDILVAYVSGVNSGRNKSVWALVADDGETLNMAVMSSKESGVIGASGNIRGHVFHVRSFEPVLKLLSPSIE